MIKQLTINGQLTYDDLGVAIEGFPVIGTAKPRITYVQIPGRSGDLEIVGTPDGEIIYGTRDLSFVLIAMTEAKRAELETLHNGQTVEIILPDDPGHYFRGRAIVDMVSIVSAQVQRLAYRVVCEPWRYKLADTVVQVVPSTAGVNITLQNEGKWNIPTITVTGAAVQIIFEGVTYSASVGTQRINSIKLKTGANAIAVKGAASSRATFTYREAIL